MKGRFTPGPWKIRDETFRKRRLIIEAGRKGYASYQKVASVRLGRNASIIAAAPDLYEALDAAKDYLQAQEQRSRTSSPDVYLMVKDDYQRCLAALAKARGEEVES